MVYHSESRLFLKPNMAGRHRSHRVASGQEEWQMARSWLSTLGVLPDFHRAFYPNSSVFDLAQCLRDGVLLCQVANRLRPNSVPDINMRPQMSPFYCMKNIRSFLASCSREFGLTQEALFDASELFDVSDFAKVIRTLSILSHTQYAIAAGFDPFPPDDSGHDVQDEDIYSNLEDLALNRDIIDEENPYDAVTIEEDTKIYEDLVSYQKVVPKPERQTSIEEKRKYVVAEILETEKSYVDALKMIQEHFIKRLQISPDDKSKIFLNIEELLVTHTKFVKKLEKVCNDGGVEISQVFIEFRDELLKYGKYCTKMPEAQNYIDYLSKSDPKFKDALEECQRRANSKFALRSLLVVPFQRVLKYPLLIQELNKQTRSTHTDKKGLEKALATVQDVAKYINQLKRDDENLRSVQDVQESLSSEVDIQLLSFGHLIKDGELLVKVSDQPPKKRHAFLLDKALIICKAKSDTYHHKQSLHLQYFEIQDAALNSVKNNKFSHSWHMKGEQGDRNSCDMSTKTLDMKTKWITDLTMAIENLTLRKIDQGNHDFQLNTFYTPTYCRVCNNLLWGLINQGYKCAVCDVSAHKDCIPKSSPCISSPGNRSKFPGTSPFRPNVSPRNPFSKSSSTNIPPSTLSPDLSKNRKASAPARMRSGTLLLYAAISNFAGLAPGGRPNLSFVIGDEIEVINKNDPEWWEGRSKRTGAVGYFPQSHVTAKATSRYEETTIREESHPTPPPSSLNSSLKTFNWFAGRKDRPQAEQMLSTKSDGTFLIRESVSRAGEYALSVKFRNNVKHIKIPYEEGAFYLTKAISFGSIQELVDYYKLNTLGVSFPGLDTNLRHGVNEEPKGKAYLLVGVGWAKAMYPYSARNAKEISIQRNSKILILNKEGDWWKGECDGQVGYFPSNYVEVLKENIDAKTS
ncbi:proto-oncogene vav-like isoform X2 [Montipora foliosa]|uniref:proto-oncogene vav-like isoform X2 n=1 Tax=Montipora foliosa TaxID=591990 RepID=UPI0035F19967